MNELPRAGQAMPDASDGPPPTVILVHSREKRKKCTVECLRHRPGFEFCKFPRIPELHGEYVRLGIGGPLLSEADADKGLLVLDGTWKLARRMEPFVRNVPLRSLGPWVTAYPRSSKVSDDPSAGLSTIEAVFAAYTALGRPTAGLLDDYHWKDEFVSLNRDLLHVVASVDEQ